MRLHIQPRFCWWPAAADMQFQDVALEGWLSFILYLLNASSLATALHAWHLSSSPRVYWENGTSGSGLRPACFISMHTSQAVQLDLS